MKKYRVAHDVREQIINRIKNDGVSVSEVARTELKTEKRLEF